MKRTTTLAAALILAAAPLALAQPAPPPPGGPGGPAAEERDGPRGGPERGRERDERRGGPERGERPGGPDRDERGERHGGPERGERGERRGPPHGPREAGTSFRLDLGPAGSLTVRCGDEPLGECVGAAQPLIDAVSGGAMMPQPTTTPGSVVPLPPVRAGESEALDVPLPPDAASESTPLPDGLSGTVDADDDDGPNEETPVIDGLEGGQEPGPAN